MQALHEIVKEKISSIYQKNNNGIFILLKQFKNYFTLNYDPFLYMLLLKYKPLQANNNAIVIEPSLQFIGNDLDSQQENIYSEIKTAREKGILNINFGDEKSSTTSRLNMISKTEFLTAVKCYSKNNNKNWSGRIIEKIIDKILKEENNISVLSNLDDGSKYKKTFFGDEFVFNTDSVTQNLFFLHGAFHIYKDGNEIKKITQTTDKALYDRLEEILNADNKDIVCIFQSENKLEAIKCNPYLFHCYNKLAELSGNIVIIGSSLDDNDNHIFSQINKSKIKNVFISTKKKAASDNIKKAKVKFPNKKVFMFDADTISYEIPDKQI